MRLRLSQMDIVRNEMSSSRSPYPQPLLLLIFKKLCVR